MPGTGAAKGLVLFPMWGPGWSRIGLISIGDDSRPRRDKHNRAGARSVCAIFLLPSLQIRGTRDLLSMNPPSRQDNASIPPASKNSGVFFRSCVLNVLVFFIGFISNLNGGSSSLLEGPERRLGFQTQASYHGASEEAFRKAASQGLPSKESDLTSPADPPSKAPHECQILSSKAHERCWIWESCRGFRGSWAYPSLGMYWYPRLGQGVKGSR